MAAEQTPEACDLLIFGSGGGGKLLAWTFADKGWRVAVVERKYVGGSCPNIACLPSKNVIHTTQVAQYIRRSQEFGIAMPGRMPYIMLRDAILAHPTIPEGLVALFSAAAM